MDRIHIEKQELKKAELWRDEDTGQYFFRLEYLCENDAEVYRLIFPKVETGIPLMQPYIIYDDSMFPGIYIPQKLHFIYMMKRVTSHILIKMETACIGRQFL